MKWQEQSYGDYLDKKKRWRKWWAWLPVDCKKEDRSYDCTVWGETVMKRYFWTSGWDNGYWSAEYMTVEEYNKTQLNNT